VVAQGGFWLGQYTPDARTVMRAPAASTRPLAYDGADYIVRSLSLRERQILHCTAIGKTSKEIAHKLYLSESSVRTYWYRILSKLNALNKAEAIARAARLGLLDMETANGVEMSV
jgi:DNA-binding CsgD family transcriptional regulator